MSNNVRLEVRPAPFPNGVCPTTLSEWSDWIQTWDFAIPGDFSNSENSGVVFIQEGQLPGPDDRNKIIIVTDTEGDPKYLGKWVEGDDGNNGCCGPGEICCLHCGPVGELKIISRSQQELGDEQIPTGWALASELEDNTQFFSEADGAAPGYYTIRYQGC